MITTSLALAWIKGRELTPVSSCDTHAVIKSFRHRGVERFFLRGSLAGIQPKHANRLRFQLGRLDAAKSPREMDLPGWRLHPLRGDSRAVGPSGWTQAGGWSSRSMAWMPSTSTTWITTDRNDPIRNAQSTAPWRGARRHGPRGWWSDGERVRAASRRVARRAIPRGQRPRRDQCRHGVASSRSAGRVGGIVAPYAGRA